MESASVVRKDSQDVPGLKDSEDNRVGQELADSRGGAGRRANLECEAHRGSKVFVASKVRRVRGRRDRQGRRAHRGQRVPSAIASSP